MVRSVRWKGARLAGLLAVMALTLGAFLFAAQGTVLGLLTAYAEQGLVASDEGSYNFWFEYEGEDPWLWAVVDDAGKRTGTFSATLNTSELSGVDFKQEWHLMEHVEDGQDIFYDEALTVDEANCSATIDASRLPDDVDGAELRVDVFRDEVHRDNFLGAATCWVDVVEEEENYNKEEGASVVPGDRYYIDKTYRGRVRNAEHPNGEDIEYPVVKVEIESQNPDEQGKKVVELLPSADAEAEHAAAILQAVSHGTATVKMTCKDVHDQEWSYTFDLGVVDNYYSVWVNAEGSNQVLPGGQVVLHAGGRHRTEGQEDKRDGFTFKWELAPGNDVYVEKLKPNEDGSLLTVTFKSEAEMREALDLPDDEQLNETFRIRATLCDNDEECESSDYYWVHVAHGYVELYPLEVENVPLGETWSFPLELRSYEAGQDGYTLVPGVTYALDYDDKAIDLSVSEATDAGDSKVTTATLTRLDYGWTEFSVTATWDGDGGKGSIKRYYPMDDAPHELYFADDDDLEVGPACAKTVTIDVSELKNFDGTLQINVGKVHFEEGHEGPIYDEELSEKDGEFKVVHAEDDSYVRVTVYGEAVAKHELDEVAVMAAYIIPGRGVISADGRQVKLNKERGHKLEEIQYQSDNASFSNWHCLECDKLFADQNATKQICAMYRLYNPNSGEHFYTANPEERNNVKAAGWHDEGIGWFAPAADTSIPVYRMYNKNAGEHHYAMEAKERDDLITAGWTYEGIGWYSDPAQAVPLHREYNPNQFAWNHNYTTNHDEHDYLVSLGWKDEGIAWYAVKAGK